MRPLFASFLVVLGAVAACTTFDFPQPASESSDAGGETGVFVDAAPEGGPPDGATSDGGAPASTAFLPQAQAARLCTLVFACPRLADAIQGSLAVPLGVPASALNFSGCVDWLAGPIPSKRVGLAQQQMILGTIASATTCAAAYAASPIQPDDDAGSCASTSCAGASSLETCNDAGAFTIPCAPPVFEKAGTCGGDGTGNSACIQALQCPTAGVLTCSSGGAYLRDCYGVEKGYTSFNCELSGRTCVAASGQIADCVAPGKVMAPCPAHDVEDSCMDNSVVYCAGGLLGETEFDCSLVGRTCSATSGAARCVGVDAGDACTQSDEDMNVCADAGSSITVCIGGVKGTFDCSSIQKACLPGSAGQTAHCG